ncbi:unnamed protein product [Amoebophrya sp. A25]|nr:unnamed protein product [Amoebophrya sp. A25]|eukprot:GSA25T00013025001.1
MEDTKNAAPPDTRRIAIVGSGLAAVACARRLCEAIKLGRGNQKEKVTPTTHVYLFTARGKFTTQMHGARNQDFCKPKQPFYDYGCQYITTYKGSPFCEEIEGNWLASNTGKNGNGHGGPLVQELDLNVRRGNKARELGGVSDTTTLSSGIRLRKAVVPPGTTTSSTAIKTSDVMVATSEEQADQVLVRGFYSSSGMWNLILALFQKLEQDFPGIVTVVRGFPKEDLMVKGLVQHECQHKERGQAAKCWSLKLGKRRPQPTLTFETLEQLKDSSGSSKKVGPERGSASGPVFFDVVIGAFSQHVLFEPFLKSAVKDDDVSTGGGGERGARSVITPCQDLLEKLVKSRCNQMIPMQVKVRFKEGLGVPKWLGMHVVPEVAQTENETTSIRTISSMSDGGFPISFVGNNTVKQEGTGGGTPAQVRASESKPSSSQKNTRWGAKKQKKDAGIGDASQDFQETAPAVSTKIAYLTVLSTAAYAEYEFNLGTRQGYRKSAEKVLIKALDDLLFADAGSASPTTASTSTSTSTSTFTSTFTSTTSTTSSTSSYTSSTSLKMIADYEVNRILHWEDAVPVNAVSDSSGEEGSGSGLGSSGCLFDETNSIAWCGDICVAPCAEGAWLSGCNMADRTLVAMGLPGLEKTRVEEVKAGIERIRNDDQKYSSTDIGVLGDRRTVLLINIAQSSLG